MTGGSLVRYLFEPLCHTDRKEHGGKFQVTFGIFLKAGSPVVDTYFKTTSPDSENADRKALQSLRNFQDKLKAFRHYPSKCDSIDDLNLQFLGQLRKPGRLFVIEPYTRIHDRNHPSFCSMSALVNWAGLIHDTTVPPQSNRT